MRLAVSLLLLCSGCSIQKFNDPAHGWSSTVIVHERVYGLKAKIPYGGAGSMVEVMLGWGSSTFTVIPSSTNKVYSAPIADTFSLGQDLQPFSTQIKEATESGWEGQPPQPRYQIFTPPPEKLRQQ